MRILTILLLSGLIISCGKKEEKQVSPVSFEMNVFRLESEGGCKSDTLPCASYEVSYPEFTGLASSANDSLKYEIAKAVDVGSPEADTISFKVAGRIFIQDFEETKKDFPESAIGWYYKSRVEVNVMSDTLISLAVGNEYFTGGAHGGYGTFFINVNPTTGKKLTLDDFLKPGYKEAFNKLGEQSFRAGLELPEGSSLADEGFEFPDNQFALNDNYGFTSDGILFVFNIYEVGPYVLGAQTASISYNDIKDWLK